MSVLSVVCCHVDVSETGHSLVLESPTVCDVSECDLETTSMKKPMSSRTVEP